MQIRSNLSIFSNILKKPKGKTIIAGEPLLKETKFSQFGSQKRHIPNLDKQQSHACILHALSSKGSRLDGGPLVPLPHASDYCDYRKISEKCLRKQCKPCFRCCDGERSENDLESVNFKMLFWKQHSNKTLQGPFKLPLDYLANRELYVSIQAKQDLGVVEQPHLLLSKCFLSYSYAGDGNGTLDIIEHGYET